MTTIPSSEFPVKWQKALTHSQYLNQRLTAHPAMIPWLETHTKQAIPKEEFDKFVAQYAVSDEGSLKFALRKLRQHVMAHLIIRDLCYQAPLQEVMKTMTMLADFCTNYALSFLHHQLCTQYGEPLDKQGMPQHLMVVGMGKLGGGELNVSSDVDFVFIYPEEGETTGTPEGGRKIEAYDFFVRLGKKLIAILDEPTGDGQVFRVDMRLRPNGDSGPLVCSILSLENYFIAQGREWERYAWIKARVLNSGENLQSKWQSLLQKTVSPFIFRRYLDFGAINAMSDLHSQIRREVTKKGMDEHIKLGPGGIREIEFIAQVFQLIRGGRDHLLQCRPTLEVLSLLPERHLLTPEIVSQLVEAYDFLRRLEHRLQYVQDAQTHTLPSSEEERLTIARSMDFENWADMLACLNKHRELVSSQFETIFAEEEEKASVFTELWFEEITPEDVQETFSKIGFKYPKKVAERLQSFRSGAKYQQLPAPNRERLDAVGPHLIEAASITRTPDITWQRLLDFIESISRRGAYLALLQQHPQSLQKVAQIIGSSAWAAEYLTRHPILLDEVLDPRLYDTVTDWSEFKTELLRKLSENEGDTEREMDILREAHHAQVFRLLAQDIAGLQIVEKLADHLTELADIMVNLTMNLCWERLKGKHPSPDSPPKFAVIAYGKLGGKELSYGSDLDLVLLHDDPEPGAGELYARLGQRMSTWMSTQTPAGQLFETDFRLRPNGDAGLFVCPIEAFEEYQFKQAWTWEHQALTRARFCAGSQELGKKFETIRRRVLQKERDLNKLKEEVLEMRARMLKEHASKSEEIFDIKQNEGGLVDVEFIVQYLILGYAGKYPELCNNLGNIALLGIAAKLELIDEEMTIPAQNAYREFRRLQHHLRLDGINQIRVERDAYSKQIGAIRTLWEKVFKA